MPHSLSGFRNKAKIDNARLQHQAILDEKIKKFLAVREINTFDSNETYIYNILYRSYIYFYVFVVRCRHFFYTRYCYNLFSS